MYHNFQERPLVFRLNDGGGPDLVRQVFLECGWQEYDEDSQSEDDWNIWWKTSRFRNCDSENLKSWQRLNHYPKTSALTRKDALARNLKRMKGIYGPLVYNFSPLGYNLPNDYTRFVNDYTKLKQKQGNKKSYWICKPADLSRGRGIFMFHDLSQLQYDCNAVVQKYISNPFLISGYKFDLRIYVCVPSFHPMYAYICEEGIVRFSTEKFDLSNLDNVYAHLTNTSINKYGPQYTTEKHGIGAGCKWTLTQLRHYFHQNNVDDRLLWTRVVSIVILTLIVQAPTVPKVNNCFELYGFDIIIDENLKPWLLEVNFSPALNSDCQTDITVKKPMLHGLMQMLNFKDVDIDRGKTNPDIDNKTDETGQRFGIYRKVLPRINSESNQYKSYVCEDSDDSDPDSNVRPGCGLPSVQIQRQRTSIVTSASSGCSSAEDSGIGSSLRRPSTRATSRRSSYSNRSNDDNLLDSRRKENSKTSLLSTDSAISCRSGSENSDLCSITEQKSSTTKSDELVKISQIPAKNSVNESILNEPDFGVNNFATCDRNNNKSSQKTEASSSDVLGRYSKPVPDFDLNLEMRKSLERYKKACQPSISHFPIAENTIQKPLSPVRDRPKITNISTRTLPSRSDHRQRGNISRRQSCVSLDSSLAQQRKPSQFRNISPPKTARPANMGNLFTPIKPSKKHKGPKNRFGDFFLVFPFNEATRKVAGNLDARIVIREVSRMIKSRTNEMKGDSSPRTGAVSMETINNVCDTPLIWGPVRPPTES